ncbi:hypothetical protein QAD02_020806 [Eretmocerus hayati]|uniref:Uncharacterized protein n=1 Tax=Eretmocerus hayati TaxID=131215 RepID=A0ACC2PNH9_9HYME|nr:hypothetical protein QAD02_020806 [Eretmocerus hayati]
MTTSSLCICFFQILRDFREVDKGADTNFIREWPQFVEKVMRLAGRKKDKTLTSIRSNNKEIAHQAHKNTLALISLPFLFKKIAKQTSRSKSKSSWDPEKEEVLKALIHHVEDIQNEKESLEKIYQDLLGLHVERKILLKPYVVIFGKTLSEIQSAYVVLNENHYYKTETTLQAVTLCFKAMHVSRIEFPLICNHVWQLLNKKVYCLDKPDVSQSVEKLTMDLDSC